MNTRFDGRISPHAETINTDAFRTMQLIDSLGCKRGVVLNPATPLNYVESYLEYIDLLTIMTVDIGFAGQRPAYAAFFFCAENPWFC